MDFDLKRALRGLNMVHSTERYKSSLDNLGDALLDLIHYAHREGRDFEKELEWARKAYVEDIEILRRNNK